MTTWYAKAQSRMKELGRTHDELASHLRLTRSAVGHYLNGRREPCIDDLRIIAKVLNWTIDELIGDGPQAARRVPVAGTAHPSSDGIWTDLATSKSEGSLVLPSSGDGVYAVRVVGDCFAPVIRSGWFLLVEPHRDPVGGEYILVKTTAGLSMVRELLFTTGELITLSSVVPEKGRQTLHADECEYMHYAGMVVPPSKWSLNQ